LYNPRSKGGSTMKKHVVAGLTVASTAFSICASRPLMKSPGVLSTTRRAARVVLHAAPDRRVRL